MEGHHRNSAAVHRESAIAGNLDGTHSSTGTSATISSDSRSTDAQTDNSMAGGNHRSASDSISAASRDNTEAGLSQLLAQVPPALRHLTSAGPVNLASALLEEEEAVGIAESRTRVAIPLPRGNNYQNYHDQTQEQQLDALFSPAALAALTAATAEDQHHQNNSNTNLTQLTPLGLHDQLAILLLRKNLREARQIQQAGAPVEEEGRSSVATATQILDQMQRLQDRVRLEEQLQQQLPRAAAFPPSSESESSSIHNVLPPKVASIVMRIMNDRHSRRRPHGGNPPSMWAALQEPIPPGLLSRGASELLQEEEGETRRNSTQAGTKRETSQDDTKSSSSSTSGMMNTRLAQRTMAGEGHASPVSPRTTVSNNGSSTVFSSSSSSFSSSSSSTSSSSAAAFMPSSRTNTPGATSEGDTADSSRTSVAKRQRVSESLEESN